MFLPNGGRAVVDIRKLRDYCLNPAHPRGRHKAKVFASALGLTADDAEALRAALLEAARTIEAEPGEDDGYGERYTVRFELEYAGRRAVVESGWIIRRGETVPRLATCFVPKKRRK